MKVDISSILKLLKRVEKAAERGKLLVNLDSFLSEFENQNIACVEEMAMLFLQVSW